VIAVSGWQVDFYRRPLQNDAGQPLWELLICDDSRLFTFSAFCPQSEASVDWLTEQLQHAIVTAQATPDQIWVFRPQSWNLIEAASQSLGILAIPTRQTAALKRWLRERANDYLQMPNYSAQTYSPLAIDKSPPLPLPETLWGEQWRFATLVCGEMEATFKERPIPIFSMPQEYLPLTLGLASTVAIPGVVIDGGQQSMRLARWLQEAKPAYLDYVPGEPNGLLLESGLAERWILTTFTDPEVKAAAQNFATRTHLAKGVHFLLIQPDNSGMTFSGFWLLRKDSETLHSAE
jgi:hypothetical protein